MDAAEDQESSGSGASHMASVSPSRTRPRVQRRRRTRPGSPSTHSRLISIRDSTCDHPATRWTTRGRDGGPLHGVEDIPLDIGRRGWAKPVDTSCHHFADQTQNRYDDSRATESNASPDIASSRRCCRSVMDGLRSCRPGPAGLLSADREVERPLPKRGGARPP